MCLGEWCREEYWLGYVEIEARAQKKHCDVLDGRAVRVAPTEILQGSRAATANQELALGQVQDVGCRVKTQEAGERVLLCHAMRGRRRKSWAWRHPGGVKEPSGVRPWAGAVMG